MGVVVLILMMVVAGLLTMRPVLGQERKHVFYAMSWRRRKRRRGAASGQRLTRRVGGRGGGRGAVGEGGGHAWLLDS